MEERVEVGTATTPVGAVRVRIEIDESRERVAAADVREEYQPSARAGRSAGRWDRSRK